MCCCGKPTINGELGYSWDGQTRLVRQPDPPELIDGESLLFDEPGRCGGLDAHCHHFRLVMNSGRFYLLVKHGGGTERITLASWNPSLSQAMLHMDSNTRFWLLHSIYQTASNLTRKTSEQARTEWSRAFLEKRIRKQKRKGNVRVWIETTAATT